MSVLPLYDLSSLTWCYFCVCRLYLIIFLIVRYLGLQFLQRWVPKHRILLIGILYVVFLVLFCDNKLSYWVLFFVKHSHLK